VELLAGNFAGGEEDKASQTNFCSQKGFGDW
jgi:hypothetical protein